MTDHTMSERSTPGGYYATCSCGWSERTSNYPEAGKTPAMRMQARIAAHYAAQNTEGKYEARVVEGQGLVLSGRVGIVATLAPAVVWVPTEGTEVMAWQGQGYDGKSAKLRSHCMGLARTKRDVLANYLKLNKRRWETVQDEEKRAADLVERQRRRTKAHLERLAPALLKALQGVINRPGDLASRAAAELVLANAESPPQSEDEFRERWSKERERAKAGAR